LSSNLKTKQTNNNNKTNSYDKSTDAATVTITSILSYPFKFSTASFIGTSTFTIQDSTPLDQTCDENSGDCIQTTTFIIEDISESVCTFTGDYEFEWTQVCRGSNCPDDLNPISATVSLESSNVCSSIKVYSSISGSLGSFEQDDFLSTQTSFIVGDYIFFEADFVSDVEVDHYELVNLYITYDSDQRYLIQDGLVSSIGLANDFSSNGLQFSFQISVGTTTDGDLIINSSKDIAMTFEVYAEFEVYYKTSFKKRSIQSQQLSLSKKISIISKTTQDHKYEMIKESSSSSSSSSTFVYPSLESLLLLHFSCLFTFNFFFFGLFVCK